MSDLYDSLEDECDEKKTSPDSSNKCKADALETSRNRFADSDSPFYLDNRVIEETPNSIDSFQYEKAEPQRKNFLPKIENAAKGWEPTSNLIVDNEVLREQGLQINNDGSFTKSPRPLADELPFITREYRNLQFQKRKTYRISRKVPRTKFCKKNIFSFTNNPVDGISMNKIISARQEKGSSEEILTSADSLSSRLGNHSKVKELLPNDNLTDSMKEKLLSQTGSPCETAKTRGTLKKTKRVMNLLEEGKGSQQSKGSSSRWQSQRKTNAEHRQNSFCIDQSVSTEKKTQIAKPRIPKQQSDIVLNCFKPSLSYSERRQMESGFNPLHLRQRGKKVLSDTSRSNFGDSVEERLSEISSRILSSENLPDEDEELFYQELMKKDKSQKPVQRSSRSEGPNEFPKLNSSVESGSYKEQKQARQNTSRFRPITKSMSIDLPSETTSVTQTSKKHPHYCSADSSPNMSKFELALKAKTYGYLANARNIFKMKAQSEGRLSAKGDKNSKLGDENPDSEEVASVSGGPNRNFAFTSVLPEIKSKKPPCKVKTCEAKSKNSLHGFALPRVNGAETQGTSKIQMEMLRIKPYLNSPNGRIEGVVSSTVK